MRGAPGGGRAPTGGRSAAENKNWIEDCYWPRSGSSPDPVKLSPSEDDDCNKQVSDNRSTSENTLSSNQGSDSDAVDHVITTRGIDAPRVRSVRSENHIRVLALNNTFSNWKHSSSSSCNGSENIEHQDLNKKNTNRSYQNVQTIEEVDETCENILPSPKLIQPKFKSKLPFSPRSYRKSYNHNNWC